MKKSFFLTLTFFLIFGVNSVTAQLTVAYDVGSNSVVATYNVSQDSWVNLGRPHHGEPSEPVVPETIDYYFFCHWSFPPTNPLSYSAANAQGYLNASTPVTHSLQSSWINYWNNYNTCFRVEAFITYSNGSSRSLIAPTICHYN